MNSALTIITIAGNNSSGKSTIAKLVAVRLVRKHESVGDWMKSMASEKGITLEQLSLIAESDPSIDKELDELNKKIGTQHNVVLDSRLGFHFIPESFKVFLSASPEVAAKRFMKDLETNKIRLNESESTPKSWEEAAELLQKRYISERKRYKDQYGIKDHTDPQNFDLIVDTGLPEFNGDFNAIVLFIHDNYDNWLRSKEKKVLVS
jgi:cytidylate kinase